MIYLNHYQIDKELINDVITLYNETHNIDIISSNLNLDPYLIFHILLFSKTVTDIELTSASIKANLDDSKIVLISDTHFGSALENQEYTERVYEYCLQNNIKTVLHAGDFLQSNKKPLPWDFRSTYYQAIKAIEDYPLTSTISTYILLGNHDVHAINKNNEVLDILQSREDFHILGPKRAYLKWQDNLISLSHKIDKFHLLIPNLQSLICFAGHRHRLVLEESKVYLPSLSDDRKGPKNESIPGFIVATIIQNEIILEYHTFEEKEKILTYTKKIGEENEWSNNCK